MKNHFYIPYAGNKRNEINIFYNNINFDNIGTIVEPYCGSCAMSYYIWTKKPNLKYILNDANTFLKDMYDIIKDDDRCLEFETNINNLISSFKNNKNKYLEVIDKQKTLYGWFIANKIYSIRPGLFPKDKNYKEQIKLSDYPIYNFFKNGNIEFTSEDGLVCYAKYKNDETNLLLLDPPYINSCNYFYNNIDNNTYEYFYKNHINKEKAKIYLILEDIWIIRLLFNENPKLETYEKKYEMTKKKTNHIVIYNRL
jgi:hypothetical protein